MKLEGAARNVYHEGLEESIRRCEELLAFTPVPFQPGARASLSKEQKLKSVAIPSDSLGAAEGEVEWNKNMELLSKLKDVEQKTSISDDQQDLSEKEADADSLESYTDNSGPSSSEECAAESSTSACNASPEQVISSPKQVAPLEDSVAPLEDGVAVKVLVEEVDESKNDEDKEVAAPETPLQEEAKPTEAVPSEPQLKFCPLGDKPPRRRRARPAPVKNANFFNALNEIMDNLRSYIHVSPLNNNASGMERLSNLSKPRTDMYKRLAEVKAVIEQNRMKECSFKPAVGRGPESQGGSSIPVVQRLTGSHQARQELRCREARWLLENEELSACSFRPKINFNPLYLDKNNYQPLPDRFKELEERRREKLERAMQEQFTGFTFKPELNPKSVQLFKQKGLETVDLASRLHGMGQSVHFDCKNEFAVKKNSTFAPEINMNTAEIIACSRQFGGQSTNFFARQQQYERTLQEKRKQKENEMPSFTPTINHMLTCPPESPEERLQRLAYKDKTSQMLNRQKAAVSDGS